MTGTWEVLSLFTGIGGIDLGLQRAGMTIAGQVEIDPWCRSILEKHWPEVPRHDDVRTAAGWWLSLVADAESERRGARRTGRPASGSADGEGDAPPGLASRTAGRPAVDLVCGGFPCQPVSLAGKGLAQADSRWLWPDFADVVRHLRPSYVLVENVPGLLGRGMGDVLGDLAGLGYDAEWDCISAAHVGAPHLRERIWIVAYPCSARRREVARSAHGDESQDARRSPSHDHVAGGAGQERLPAVAYTNGAGLEERRRPEPVRAELSAPERRRQAMADSGRLGRGEGPRIFRGLGSARRGAELADAASERRGRSIFPRPDLVNDRPQPAHSDAGIGRTRDWWLTEPDVGRVAHGIPRRVDRLRGLGNAVVPQVAEHIGRLIIEADTAR